MIDLAQYSALILFNIFCGGWLLKQTLRPFVRINTKQSVLLFVGFIACTVDFGVTALTTEQIQAMIYNRYLFVGAWLITYFTVLVIFYDKRR